MTTSWSPTRESPVCPLLSARRAGLGAQAPALRLLAAGRPGIPEASECSLVFRSDRRMAFGPRMMWANGAVGCGPRHTRGRGAPRRDLPANADEVSETAPPG